MDSNAPEKKTRAEQEEEYDDEHGGEYGYEHRDESTPLVPQNKNKSKSKLKAASSAIYLLHNLSKSHRERRKLLFQSKLGSAAFLIRDAVLGDQVEHPANGAYDPYTEISARNSLAILCHRYCSTKWIIKLLQICLYILVILTFIEPPHWCRSDTDGACQDLFNAQGPPAAMSSSTDNAAGVEEDVDDNNIVYYYPSSNAMWLTSSQSQMIEGVLLTIISLILIARICRDGADLSVYLRSSYVKWNRLIQMIMILLLIISLIVQQITPTSPITQFHPYFRLILLGSFMDSAPRRDIRVLFDMLPEVFRILLLLFLITLVYAWFAGVMFVDTDEGDQLFPNLIEACWTLWICVTTANYPDVMMPGYNENRWMALYFISFMIISFFFLMNVVLAFIVDAYDNAVSDQRQAHQDQAQENLKKAYKMLLGEEEEKSFRNQGSVRSMDSATSNVEYVTRQTVMSLFQILNEDFPEFRTLSDDDTKLLYAILDKDGSDQISEDEFMDFGSVMLLEFINTSDYATFVERYFPRYYQSDFWQRFCRFVKAPHFEYGIDVILLLNGIVVAIQSWPELSDATVIIDKRYWDGSIDTAWELLETMFTTIYTLEMISKIAVFGWKAYSEEMRNMFDFSITILAIFSTAMVYYPNDYSDSRLIRMILAARVLRLIRLLAALKPFQMIFTISTQILPAATSVCTILFLLLYFFAYLGVHLFGGLVTRDPNNPLSYRILDTDFSDSDYWANNFNDMISAMNVLFNLLVVNNWFVHQVGIEAVVGSRWVRLYFLVFHVLGVILVNNLVIAFIITKFLQELAIFREQHIAEVVGDGEAVIRARRAVFDASQVTGTRTSLSGAYIARLRHASSDMGSNDRHHERLRTLFTQTSDSELSSSNRASKHSAE